MSKKIDEVRALLISGNLARAKIMGEKLCKQTRSSDLFLLLAIATARLGDVTLATEYAKKSIEVDQSFADAHFFLATAYREQHEIGLAIQSVKRGLELNPHSGEGHNKLGVFLRLQNKIDEAEASFRSAVENDPNNAHANFNLGSLMHQKMELIDAQKQISRTLAINPSLAEAHNERGAIFLKQGKLKEALNSLNRAITIKQDYAEAYTNMGQVLDVIGKRDKAIICLRKAIEVDPESMDGRNVLANNLLESGGSGLNEALKEFKDMLELDPEHIPGLVGLATAYLYLGEETSCIESVQQILELHPDSEIAMAGVANIYDRLGRFDDAYNCLRPAIKNGITAASTALLFASICRHVSKCDSAIDQIQIMLRQGGLIPNDERLLNFALAKLFDRQKNFNTAFKCYEKANNLKFFPFNLESTVNKFSSLKEVYSENFLKTALHSENKSEKMVFIVGMPRSGTSLIEQVLASHSQVYGAGELVYISMILKKMQENRSEGKGYPYCMQKITIETLNEMANKYLECLPKQSNQYLRVTDKLPNNFLHLGVIEMLFPNARIIHCLRDPLDTCLSCYFQDFTGFFNYAYNLEHLGSYYQQYQKLMKHWKRVLNIPVLDMQYEDMVVDTEKSVRSILKFCGLPWENACLDFYNNSRVVNTASYDQVRSPIYKGSMARWKNYSNHISTLKKALGVEHTIGEK